MPSPPSHDEIEVSIFGPGYGESIVIHTLDDNWLIVDSCINPNSGRNIPLDYLESLGVNVASNIRLVVASHWHDDHVRDLSSVVKKCKAAKFACSIALTQSEFTSLIYGYGKGVMTEKLKSGVSELYEIFEYFRDPEDDDERDVSSVIYALENSVLWSGSSEKGTTYRIHALSPSNYSFSQTLMDIAEILPQDKTPIRRVDPTIADINHLAVVLRVEIGDFNILLGSDMGSPSGETRYGWVAVLGLNSGPPAQVFKIPHHGSARSDNPNVWSQMLIENPHAVCTTYNRGKVGLPCPTDIERIKNYTDNAYITSTKKLGSSLNNSAVEKTIRESNIQLTTPFYSVGQIRFRCNYSDSDNLDVSFFSDASRL